MSWTTAISELRDQLGDNASIKLRYRKNVIGRVDGTNKVFKTFEYRRVTDFTTAVAPEGVYVNGSAATVSIDFPDVGEFTLSSAPAEGDEIEATYHSEWLNDSELDGFLKNASSWLGQGADYTTTPIGLQHAAKFYAAKQAVECLALRWADHLSEVYKMEDAPKNMKEMVASYTSQAEMYFKQAQEARKGFYTRQDQSEAPLFANIPGVVVDVAPKR